MGSSNGRGDHIIHIWKVDKERLVSMQEKIKATPKLLSKSAGLGSCSIFKLPQSLTDTNGSFYKPQLVSIGPYHHGDPQLQMIEEHKWRLLGALLVRTQSKLGLSLEDYLKAVQPLEAKAKECYSESIRLERNDFVEMLVLDGCFILELFRIFNSIVPSDPGDPIVSMSWVFASVMRDLIRIENQIPFFILEQLFETTKIHGEESDTSLSELALIFFNYRFQRPSDVIERYKSCEGKHLLHLLRLTYIPPHLVEYKTHTLKWLPQSLSNLRRSGIKLAFGKSTDSFLEVKFQRGVIYMPTIALDDFMSCFLANCVAFEQYHSGCSKHFSYYLLFWDCLIKTSEDVKYLSDRSIIENYLGSDDEVAKLIKSLGKDLVVDVESNYLSGLFIEVHKHYMSDWKHFKNSWHVQWANFLKTYFGSPWSFISLVAATLLLVPTILQTYYTILSYVKSTH